MLDKHNPGLCFSPLNGAVWVARPFTKQLALNCSLLLAFCLWICETLWAALHFWGQWPLWDGVYWGLCFVAVLTTRSLDMVQFQFICSLQKAEFWFCYIIYVLKVWAQLINLYNVWRGKSSLCPILCTYLKVSRQLICFDKKGERGDRNNSTVIKISLKYFRIQIKSLYFIYPAIVWWIKSE